MMISFKEGAVTLKMFLTALQFLVDKLARPTRQVLVINHLSIRLWFGSVHRRGDLSHK